MPESPETTPGLLTRSQSELRWVGYQPWLKSIGYALRPRFQPDWEPSWLTSGIPSVWSEDRVPMHIRGHVMDATRIEDGCRVMLKLLPTDSDELPVWQYLSFPALQADPRNHCVPLLAAHPLPDTDETVLAVMPLLIYYDEIPFETLGEMVQCIHTLIEGLAFLHEHNIAHLDICTANTMMEPGALFPKGFHPCDPGRYTSPANPLKLLSAAPYSSRTIVPVQYYLIDFGESQRYSSYITRGYVRGAVGHSLNVPEFQSNRPYDPFPLDVRALGDMLQANLYNEYYDLDVLLPLITAMREDKPTKRPTAEEALRMLHSIILELESKHLAAYLQHKNQLYAYVSYQDYRRHSVQAKLLGRPPIYPKIPGIVQEPPKPMSYFLRLYYRIQLWWL
ncbi:hypothetical protein SISSUDRAFT_982569 [Sistotremastrum suecicum HHB10207 ss-3]|uniref:Protein kinase domain-containing protein n=1 Tax=Sistotremastrum suecicum HHB10207 ss-3 TaxID=1314776 RepID=A0A166FWI6_9AGAM|nr:hypothetical protein SISSUDRAFT_982569 [Sistotremastrum suecicum HHB10207 ss-3]